MEKNFSSNLITHYKDDFLVCLLYCTKLQRAFLTHWMPNKKDKNKQKTTKYTIIKSLINDNSIEKALTFEAFFSEQIIQNFTSYIEKDDNQTIKVFFQK